MEKKVIDVASARHFPLHSLALSSPFLVLPCLPWDGGEAASGTEGRRRTERGLLFPSFARCYAAIDRRDSTDRRSSSTKRIRKSAPFDAKENHYAKICDGLRMAHALSKEAKQMTFDPITPTLSITLLA